MKRLHKLLILTGLILAILPFMSIIKPVYAQSHQVNIYYFWGDGCPHCAAEKPFLESLAQKYPEVSLHTFEVYYVEENREIFQEFGDKLGFEPRGVPTTIVGEQYWIGFREEYKQEIEAAIQNCKQNPCEMDAGKIILPDLTRDSNKKPSEHIIQIPLIGTVDLDQQSLLVSTAIIGFVDGFNPCSLWVLSVLLAITLHSGSRTKIFTVGLTFLLTTVLIYSLFITGVFTIFSYAGYLQWIQVLVAFIALIFGIINIKDYFWYKEGISFTVSDKHKPKLYQNMRSTVTNPQSLLGLIGSTAALAVGVSLIEFACTAGFPVIWSNMMIANQIKGLSFYGLLAIYMLIYLIDELVVFGSAVFTMRASRLEEKHGRVLKLISGVLILILGLAMLINPDLMNRLSTSMLVFAFALSMAWAIYIIHQRILPRFGIFIGTGFSKKKR